MAGFKTRQRVHSQLPRVLTGTNRVSWHFSSSSPSMLSLLGSATWLLPMMLQTSHCMWNQLCYNCNSCKAGLLGNLRKEWRKANIILIVAVVVLIWVSVIACSAFKNAQTEDLFRRYKQGWI
ncbi:hypothetical protein RJT34_20128 [Clitoria ternatea]|uniref:Uncharacterized protein n=1 Tax=Clitoria ternatea TaxID=43366 RepID=A0AAN9ISF4_CLITE